MKNVVTYNETYKTSALKLSLGLSRKSSVLQGVFFSVMTYILETSVYYTTIKYKLKQRCSPTILISDKTWQQGGYYFQLSPLHLLNTHQHKADYSHRKNILQQHP
jgi:hypothetical protein